ncbi:hypothetical protein IQ249_23030 [Lusitaniella coriacea LEGE 07157]|uniref:SbsA Ig-like domain-containing protein n=1 Tax=Lusitaniella coriacea LEGE 07157 TaxID=945747 RepID=A0A8J7E2E1_9CYAN|nr:Ig-like domain-containing protein [Lusitaniella coriacea]MBE9118767.1 hypothetical protein [Lusitaniella coriacea LEGE 07157]
MSKRTQKFLHPIDRAASTLILCLGVAIGSIAWAGNTCTGDCPLHAGPRVREFSWEELTLRADDTAFLLTFSRPMDRQSVEKNLTITPPLPGKVSWAGRTLAYTVDAPVPYGVNYKVQLKGAREQFANEEKAGIVMQPFEGTFKSRDRAFAYIGIEGEEQGRLILFNLTADKKTVLTPPNLVVTDFKVYPDREDILFFAVDRRSGEFDLLEQRLYTVATGLGNTQVADPEGVELAIDNRDYQNLQFDLSQDGKTIVVQRINRQDPSDFGLWIQGEKGEIQPLGESPSGDFAIAPDSQTLVSSTGEGMAVLPLDPQSEPIDFLPQFGKVLSFNQDGSAAAMVNFNRDDPKLRYVQSLYLVNNQGIQEKLLDVRGSIINCQFNPIGEKLYCLLAELIGEEQFIEQPYLTVVDLKTAEAQRVMTLPDYRDVQMSLAPDGLGLLFDRVIVDPNFDRNSPLRTNSGDAIASSRLWFLLTPISLDDPDNQPQLEELPLNGLRPRWLP